MNLFYKAKIMLKLRMAGGQRDWPQHH